MSEQQRLITKLVARLTNGVAVKYGIHLLRKETDSGAIHMLKANLEEHGIKGMPVRFWARQTISSGDVVVAHKKDLLEEANSKMKELMYEEALEIFDALRKRRGASYVDKFYRQRTEILLVMGRWNEAFEVAVKARLTEAAFVCAIAAGRFQDAENMLGQICGILRSGASEKESVVSVFELVYLVMYVVFTCKSCVEVAGYVDTLRNVTNYDLEYLFEIASQFANRSFEAFWKGISSLDRLMSMSIYTEPSLSLLHNAILQNMVANAAAPFSKVTFESLANDMGINKQKVIDQLQLSVVSGRLHGKLDMLGNAFIGSDDALANEEMLGIYTRACALTDRMELAQWRKAYASQKQ